MEFHLESVTQTQMLESEMNSRTNSKKLVGKTIELAVEYLYKNLMKYTW